jgi:Raf kinase inhibitor-like YbhB/YbcL family protein
MIRNNILSLFVLCLAFLITWHTDAYCGQVSREPNKPRTIEEKPDFSLSSLSFGNSQTIPEKYSYNMKPQCSGDNYSPTLVWKGVPAGTKSLAIIMHDPDGGDWTHWVQFNIPPGVMRLDEAKGGPDAGLKGANSFGGIGYAGPCPPRDGRTHRYILTLYALDSEINLQTGVSREYLQKAMSGHILGKAVLTGLKKRD